MEASYSTVDLVMLAIAAFIIWMTMRTPEVKSTLEQPEVMPAEQ